MSPVVVVSLVHHHSLSVADVVVEQTVEDDEEGEGNKTDQH